MRHGQAEPRRAVHDVRMPIVSGGVTAEWGPPRHALGTVIREIEAFTGRPSLDEFCVDIAFLTWHNFREPEKPFGVTPGPVVLMQRRFIIWHSVPHGFEQPEQVRAWLVSVLPETERLVREFLPSKSKAFSAAMLADEVAALRDHLAAFV
jgi:hypothetical protein